MIRYSESGKYRTWTAECRRVPIKKKATCTKCQKSKRTLSRVLQISDLTLKGQKSEQEIQEEIQREIEDWDLSYFVCPKCRKQEKQEKEMQHKMERQRCREEQGVIYYRVVFKFEIEKPNSSRTSKEYIRLFRIFPGEKEDELQKNINSTGNYLYDCLRRSHPLSWFISPKDPVVSVFED